MNEKLPDFIAWIVKAIVPDVVDEGLVDDIVTAVASFVVNVTSADAKYAELSSPTRLIVISKFVYNSTDVGLADRVMLFNSEDTLKLELFTGSRPGEVPVNWNNPDDNTLSDEYVATPEIVLLVKSPDIESPEFPASAAIIDNIIEWEYFVSVVPPTIFRTVALTPKVLVLNVGYIFLTIESTGSNSKIILLFVIANDTDLELT